MSHLNECNRYISDVPMRFTDRFLSRQINEAEVMKYDQVEDMSRFHVDDYKFDAELFAIETYVLHQKSITDARNKSAEQTAEANQPKPPLSGNTLLRQMVSSGTILTPEPVTQSPTIAGSTTPINAPYPNIATINGHTSATQSNAHSVSTCDPPQPVNGGQTNGHPKPIRTINPNDFDNNDSSPFDTLELKSINEREELFNLFRSMNTDTVNGNPGSNPFAPTTTTTTNSGNPFTNPFLSNGQPSSVNSSSTSVTSSTTLSHAPSTLSYPANVPNGTVNMNVVNGSVHYPNFNPNSRFG